MRGIGWFVLGLTVLFSCSESLDPEEVEDAEAADVVVSGGGFGLVGVLAAVAIPNYVSMGYRAKRSELPANVKAIKTALLSYDANFDTYVAVPAFHPDSSPSKHQREFRTGTGFDTLGWMPDGQVRGSYKVVVTSSTDFRVIGISDVDGDGQYASYTATKTLNVMMTTRNDVY